MSVSIGSMNRLTVLSTRSRSSQHWRESGSAAELEETRGVHYSYDNTGKAKLSNMWLGKLTGVSVSHQLTWTRGWTPSSRRGRSPWWRRRGYVSRTGSKSGVTRMLRGSRAWNTQPMNAWAIPIENDELMLTQWLSVAEAQESIKYIYIYKLC